MKLDKSSAHQFLRTLHGADEFKYKTEEIKRLRVRIRQYYVPKYLQDDLINILFYLQREGNEALSCCAATSIENFYISMFKGKAIKCTRKALGT